MNENFHCSLANSTLQILQNKQLKLKDEIANLIISMEFLKEIKVLIVKYGMYKITKIC